MSKQSRVREAVVRYGAPAFDGGLMGDPRAAARLLRDIIDDDEREHFVCIMLDGRHRATGYRVVSVGTLTSSLVDPKEIFGPALICHAGAILIGHNHPSGSPAPSAEDVVVTDRLRRAGALIGIPVVDHVIIGGGTMDYYSFRNSGRLEDV